MKKSTKILIILLILIVVFIVYKEKNNLLKLNDPNNTLKSFWANYLQAPINSNGAPGNSLYSIGNLGNWYTVEMLSNPNWSMPTPVFNGGANITNDTIYNYYKNKYPNPLSATEITALNNFDLEGYFMIYPPAQKTTINPYATKALTPGVFEITDIVTAPSVLAAGINNGAVNTPQRQTFIQWIIEKIQTIFN